MLCECTFGIRNLGPHELLYFVFQWRGSPSTPHRLTETSSWPMKTRRWRVTVTMIEWCLERLPSLRVCITGSSAWIATTTTLTLRSAWHGLIPRRTWCWAKMTRPGPCMWTTIAPGLCTTTHTPTGMHLTMGKLLIDLNFDRFDPLCHLFLPVLYIYNVVFSH